MTGTVLKILSYAFLLFFILLARTDFALAHATPITYEPAASSVIEKAPERTSIHFSERIEQVASGIMVYGPDGSRTDNGDASVDSQDEHYYGARLKNAGEGTYTVSWQVVSKDDGHFTKGAFSFSVGKETAPTISGGQIQIQHITTLPQAVTIWLELIGQATLLGAFLLFAVLWRPLRKRFGGVLDTVSFEKKFTVLIGIGVVFILIGVASFIVIKTFDLQQLRIADLSATLGTFLNTVDGSYALYRAILAIIIGSAFFLFRRHIFKSEHFTNVEAVFLLLILLIILDRARVSHAAASHFYPSFSILVNFLHSVFKWFWAGGLIVFSTTFFPAFHKTEYALAKSFAFTSFSRLVSIAFGGAGITGAYIVWLHLKNPYYIFTTEWGSRFIILTVIAIILFAARLWHQFLVEKSAVDICKGKSNATKELLVRWTRYSLPFETLVGIALLFATSLIIITTPPYPSTQFTFEKRAESQGAEIALAAHPYEQKQFLITASDAINKSELALSDIVVTLTNEERGIGPIVADTEQRFISGYIFPFSLLSPPGNWKIDISARRAGLYDVVALFRIDYPKDLEATRVHADTRPFGLFEIIILLATLGIIGLTLILFRFSKGLYFACIGLDNGATTPTQQIPETRLKTIGPWSVACTGVIIALFLTWFLNEQIFKSDFQKLCEQNGHFWLQSAPVRDEKALSSDTFTGCFLDVGLYHFVDKREYEFFFQPRQILAELSTLPEAPIAGEPADLAIILSEIKDGSKVGPARDIGRYHDRILHVQIVGEDLKTFAHIHPEDLGPITEEARKSARFPLRYTFPKAGRYAINLDYVASGRELSELFFVNVRGKEKMESLAGLATNKTGGTSQTKEFDGYSVTFTAPNGIKAGEKVKLYYNVEKDGSPVQNLEPYLAAAMHIAIVRQDLARFTHTHGEAYQPGSVWFQQLFGKYFKYHVHFAPDGFGPGVITQPWTTVFPTAGIYQVFGEFKHEREIIVTHFAVEVSG